MTETSMGQPLLAVAKPAISNDPGDEDIIKYMEDALTSIAAANVEGLRTVMMVLNKDATEEGVIAMVEKMEELFDRFNSQQVFVIKKSLRAYAEGGRLDLSEIEKMNCNRDLQEGVELVLEVSKLDAVGLEPQASLIELPQSSALVGETSSINLTPKPISELKIERKWSDTWKQVVKGVLNRHRRERVRDLAIKSMHPPVAAIPKSDTTKERLRVILSNHFLFGDLENDLREEIIDSCQDVRVSPGTEIIKQGDVADNFYIIDVGDFDILAKKDHEPYVLLRSKGAGESFGELAMMYDTTRNATVKATSHALLWAVNRTTFKFILGQHLTGSPTAQVLKEAPALKKLSTKDVVALSKSCMIQQFRRGQPILKAGSNLDKVCVVQDGQVRVSWGATVGNPIIGKGAVGGETLAVMNRLEVLGEAVLLNEETNNPCHYTASSDQVTIIVMDRVLFTKDMLTAIRKGLQIQLITVALQRVPAFLELSPSQLSGLAESFKETNYPKGKEITRSGDIKGSAARIYVVQSGVVAMYRSPNEERLEIAKGDSNRDKARSSVSSSGEPGSKGNSVVKSSNSSTSGTSNSSKLQSQHSGNYSLPEESRVGQEAKTLLGPLAPASSTSIKAVELQSAEKKSLNGTQQQSADKKGMNGSQQLSTDKRSLSGNQPSLRESTIMVPWTFTTYSVFGDECLLSNAKDESSGPPCQATTVAQTPTGVLILSISLAEITTILGPIQELLSRVANMRVLRKVPCLEYLTSTEITLLSHSMGIHRLRPGEPVYKAGEPGDRLYIVHRGTVVETTHSGKGDQVILVKGAFLGEDALLSSEPRLSTMVAGPSEPHSLLGAELFYLDRAVLEANLGPLRELNELRRRENEKRGIVKSITFEELQEIGLLGTGLFGKVKLVYSRRTKEHYALKCVSKAKVARMQEEEHLRNEKMHMSELDHPFITKLIRTFKDQKNVYLLQELTTGRELFLFMEKVGRLQDWEAAFYAGGVLLALEYMHSKGIVYRDLKPENTLIGENGYPKLIDMGFAKRIHNRRTYSMCGTPDYMAPEIIKRQGHGKAVDYWALGCMIFEMITNTSPFNRGDDPPQVVFQKITEGRMKFPSYMAANAVDIVKRLLDPNPETRLGCRKFGPAEIKEHPFFTKEINFQLLIRQKEEPPMIPPRIFDYKSLCIADDHPEPRENLPVMQNEKANWDDIF